MKQIRYRSRRRKRSTKLSGYKHYSFLLRALLFTLIAIAFTVTIYQHSSILGNHNNKEYTDFEIHKVSLQLRSDDTTTTKKKNNNDNINNNNNIIRNKTTKNKNRHGKEQDNDDDDDINIIMRSSDTTTNIEEKKKKKDDDDDDDDAGSIEDEDEDEDDTAIKKEEKKAILEADNRLAREESERLHNINYRSVQERTTTATRTTTRTTTTDNDNNNQQLPLQFIPNSKLSMLDYFSATWFLSRERFLEIDYNDILICEDAVFVCVKRKRKTKVNETKQSQYFHNSIRSTAKMTLDWTHFNVEHLSKYWTTMSLMTRTKPRPPQDMIVPLLTSMLDTVIQKRMRMKTIMTPIKKKERKILVEPSSSSLSSLSSFSSEQVKQQQLLFQQQQQQQQQPPRLVRRSTKLEQTIAIIPFMPVINKITLLTNILSAEEKSGGQQMSAYSLAATLSSLWSIGVGRVVVVSLSATDSLLYIREACQLLQKTIATMLATDDERNKIIVKINNNNNTNNNDIATIGYSITNNNNIHANQNQNHQDLDRTMEIAHVHVTDPFFYQTKHVAINVPRAAVAGLWTALSGTQFNATRNQEYNEQERRNWLGTTTRTNDWKYVYLTEPDTIVNMNMELVSSVQDALDQGISLFPHRIHPLPHEINLSPQIISTVNQGLYLPNIPPFHVTELVSPQSDTSAAAQSVIESQSTQSRTQIHTNTNTDRSSNVSSSSSSDSGAQYIACCDAGRWWPGSFCWKKEKEISNPTERHYCQERWVRDKTKCSSYIGSYWWSCGFKPIDTRKKDTMTDTKNNNNSSSSSGSSSSNTTELERIIERHHNLFEYQYMTIQDGTGAVFGSSNHGRTCLPSKVPCTH